MKLLSRAQVPTIEAGTFPQRPQTATSTGLLNTAGHLQVDNRPVSAAANLGAEKVSKSTISPEEATKAFQRPVTAVSSLMPPPSRFTSAVKPGTVDLQCLQSQHDTSWALTTAKVDNFTEADASKGGSCLDIGPATTISLYTPRPSAASATTSQHFRQLLPPKRELPFEKSKPESRSSSSRVLRSATKDSAEPEASVPKPTNVSTKSQKAQGRKSATTSSQPSIQKRKRTYAKSSAASDTAPSAKKGQSTRAKPPQAKREDSPLPSIEEVLEDQNPRGIQESKSVDTQDLLSRAEQVHSSGLHTSAAKPIAFEEPNPSLNDTFAPRVEVPDSSADAVASCTTKPGANHFPCTPASQLINPSTPSAPVICHTVDTAPAPASDENPFSTVADAYSLLMRTPAFAHSDPKLASWTALPEHQQLEALKNFMCEQYDDKTGRFQQLCKMMERTWEATIVWPEVHKGSTGI
jgi:hypothetical protein